MTLAGSGELQHLWTAAADDYATAQAWDPQFERLFVGDARGHVFAFERRGGQAAWRIRDACAGGIAALAHHPKKPWLAVGDAAGGVRLWDSREGRSLGSWTMPESWLSGLSWSPDASALAVASGRMLRILEPDGTILWSSESHPSTVSAFAWAGSEELVTACYGQAAIWSLQRAEATEVFVWRGSLVSLALAPRASIIACGSQDRSVHFWRRTTREDSAMTGYATKPAALAFDARGEVLATSGDDSVTVWSFAEGGPEGTTPGILSLHSDPVTSLAFSRRDRKLVSGARDGSIAVWSLNRRAEGACVGAAAVDAPVESVAWSKDDRFISVIDGGGGVHLYRVGGGTR